MEKARVKICGVRTLEEAECAAEAGAEMLGFNFWPPSPRYISPEAAGQIIDRLPKEVLSVGVFVNESGGRIREISRGLGLSAIQLHGDESPEFCNELRELTVIKAMRVGEGFSVERINNYGECGVDTVLLDASLGGSYGGTGATFDWNVAARAKAYARIILAGGLNANNVAEAIRIVGPFAVDVCSGVEAAPGRKDLAKIREFIRAANGLGK